MTLDDWTPATWPSGTPKHHRALLLDEFRSSWAGAALPPDATEGEIDDAWRNFARNWQNPIVEPCEPVEWGKAGEWLEWTRALDWPPWSMVPLRDRPALAAEPDDIEQAVRDIDEAAKFCEMLGDELRQRAVRDRDDLKFAANTPNTWKRCSNGQPSTGMSCWRVGARPAANTKRKPRPTDGPKPLPPIVDLRRGRRWLSRPRQPPRCCVPPRTATP